MRRVGIVMVAAACGGSHGPNIGESALELHGAPTRAGAYVAPALTHAAAAGLHADPSFTATYTGEVYAQALYVDDGGAKDRVIVATEENDVIAFDPTGHMVWMQNLGAPQPMPNVAEQIGCGNINPLGITGTPVVDYASRTIYVDAMIHESVAHHRVFALSLDDGSIKTGWPVDLGTAITGAAVPFTPASQNQRGGLTLLDNRVYIPFGGHNGDCAKYRGWVVAVPVDDPQHPTAFVTQDSFSGAWTPGGVSSDGAGVFAVFGNGSGPSTWMNSEMVGRFGSGASFSGMAKDFWVPTNWQALDGGDVDITGPALVVDLPGATPAHLIVSFGKDGNVYVEDRDNLGGIAAPVAQLNASASAIINVSAAYTTAMGTYVVFRGRAVAGCPGGNSNTDLVAVKIAPGAPPQLSLAWCAGSGNYGSPIATTTDGTHDPIVWAIGAASEDGSPGDGQLHGFDGDTGAIVFAGGGAGDSVGLAREFTTPIVAKGRVFLAADGKLVAFTP